MKKILFLLLIGVVIGYVIKSNNFVLPGTKTIPIQSSQSVEGASTSAKQNSFTEIQKAVSKLSFSDIATSSPKIQGIIHLLQQMPKEQAKVICENVCKGI